MYVPILLWCLSLPATSPASFSSVFLDGAGSVDRGYAVKYEAHMDVWGFLSELLRDLVHGEKGGEASVSLAAFSADCPRSLLRDRGRFCCLLVHRMEGSPRYISYHQRICVDSSTFYFPLAGSSVRLVIYAVQTAYCAARGIPSPRRVSVPGGGASVSAGELGGFLRQSHPSQ